MLTALIHLIFFTMFTFLCVVGISIFFIVKFAKKNPSAAMYWTAVIKRILGE